MIENDGGTLKVSVGSLIESQGSLYVVDTAAFTPTGSPVDGAYLFFDDGVPGFAWSAVAGTFDPTRGGIYDGSDRRQCRFILTSSTTWDRLIVAEAITPRIPAQPFFGSNRLTFKVLEIGDWNMDATSSVNVAHGITNLDQKIRSVSAMIRHDDGAQTYPLNTSQSGTGASIEGTVWLTDDTNINLLRSTGGLFDSVLFNATSFNRGWVTVWYEET